MSGCENDGAASRDLLFAKSMHVLPQGRGQGELYSQNGGSRSVLVLGSNGIYRAMMTPLSL